MKKKIVIIAGDPQSINVEIINKVWKKLNQRTKKRIFLIANFDLFKSELKKLNSKIPIIKIDNLDEATKANYIKIINVPLGYKKTHKIPLRIASRYVLNSLDVAHKLICKNKEIKGLINCPINKKLIRSTNKVGVTELLASKNKIDYGSEVMMIYNKNLSVVPLTTHIDIKKVSKKISSNFIQKKIKMLNKSYRNLFKKKPKIGVLGLNPHNSELKKNSEEKMHIIPAIKRLRKSGINISGPLVADTAFIKTNKKYDVIVGMYHDQVLTPFKSLFNFDAINITLGLKYIRVSPDHGPANDIIGKNKANSLSLYRCVQFINNLD